MTDSADTTTDESVASEPMSVDDITRALASLEDAYQAEAVQAAMDQGEEVVPRLLEVLETALVDPDGFLATPEGADSFLLNYAITLLGYHRVREAHALLIGLLSLPWDLVDELIGDGVDSVSIVALWKTSGGDPTEIIQLLENTDASEYCRGSAVVALRYGVADGGLARQDVLEVFHRVLSRDDSSSGEEFVRSCVASTLCDMWPGDSMDVLSEAFDQGRIDPMFISLEDVERHRQRDREAQLSDLEEDARRALDRTPHEELERWACFHPDQELSLPAGRPARDRRQSLAAQKQASANKQKRKRRSARKAAKKTRPKKKKKKKR